MNFNKVSIGGLLAISDTFLSVLSVLFFPVDQRCSHFDTQFDKVLCSESEDYLATIVN